MEKKEEQKEEAEDEEEREEEVEVTCLTQTCLNYVQNK